MKVYEWAFGWATKIPGAASADLAREIQAATTLSEIVAGDCYDSKDYAERLRRIEALAVEDLGMSHEEFWERLPSQVIARYERHQKNHSIGPPVPPAATRRQRRRKIVDERHRHCVELSDKILDKISTEEFLRRNRGFGRSSFLYYRAGNLALKVSEPKRAAIEDAILRTAKAVLVST